MSTRRAEQRGGSRHPERQQPAPRPPSYPLPKDTVAAWRAVKGRGPLNAGLVFDRFVANWGDPFDPQSRRDRREGPKGETWRELVEAGKGVDADLLTACLQRWQAVVERARGRPFALRTDWRLVTGLGRGGPLEAGFAFSRHGSPILPGSGLKGVARAWGLRQVARAVGVKELGKLEQVLSAAGDWEKDWREQLGEMDITSSAFDFRLIFGTTAEAGRAIFFDGMPKPGVKLDLDIMNPHYPEYYAGRDAPTDSQNPRPVTFLTVAPGSEFVFAVGWRGRWDDQARELLEVAGRWLRQGLLHLGAGAKTSAGYGYFVAAAEGS
ncbi:MAG: type III-B CRISPR module RAMP protein Cmr6 [Anaerolineae bacterium]|nr:type III-B CRISPR module RAMP protein Cmr6 [Anaerolineae bacterium]